MCLNTWNTATQICNCCTCAALQLIECTHVYTQRPGAAHHQNQGHRVGKGLDLSMSFCTHQPALQERLAPSAVTHRMLSSRTRLYFSLISRGNPGASTGTSSRVSPSALLASGLARCLSPLVSCTVHACWRLHQCGPDVRAKVSLQVLAPQPCQNPREPILHQGGRQAARDAILASQKLRRAQAAPLCSERV